MSAQQITCWVKFISSGEFFVCSFVYASNFVIERRSLWQDFNVTLSASEHSRSLEYLQDQVAMREFQDVVLDCGLEDLSYVGPKLTWSNGQDDYPISKKLDCGMVNSCWLRSFPNASAFFEMGGISDYARFWVQMRASPPRNRRPFQFFNHLASHPQFLEIVNEVWMTTASILF